MLVSLHACPVKLIGKIQLPNSNTDDALGTGLFFLFVFLYLKRRSFSSGKYIFNLKKQGFQSQQHVLYGAVFRQATGCLFLRACTLIQATTESTLPRLPNPSPVSKQDTTTSTKHRLRAPLVRESISNSAFSPDLRVLSQVRSPVTCM